MKVIKWSTGAIILILYLVFTSLAQDTIAGKPKLHETWISSDKLNTFQKIGILYEIMDSSILISDSPYKKDYQTGNFRTEEFDFRQIESLKLRKVNSVRNGVVIGSSVGLGLTVVGLFLLVEPGDFEGWMVPAFLSYAIGSAGIFGGIGLIAGSIKTTIPLERNYENFNRNRAKLQNYAVVKSGDYGGFEHESYLGLWQIGPSFAMGGFTDKTTEHYAKTTGYGGDVLNLGFLFSPTFGISAGGFNHEYDVADDNKEMCWMFSGLVAGPLFAFPVGRKFFLDLNPRIGFSDVTFYTDQGNQSSISGFALYPCACFRYNLSKRWSLISETGFLNIKTREQLYGQDHYQSFNLNAGIAYRFR